MKNIAGQLEELEEVGSRFSIQIERIFTQYNVDEDFLSERIEAGTTFFMESKVSPSFNETIFVLKFSCAEDSFVHTKRVPICTPSAPNANTANIAFPELIPPAAINGI